MLFLLLLIVDENLGFVKWHLRIRRIVKENEYINQRKFIGPLTKLAYQFVNLV